MAIALRENSRTVKYDTIEFQGTNIRLGRVKIPTDLILAVEQHEI